MKHILICIIFCSFFILHTSALSREIKSIQLVCDHWPGYTNQDGTVAYWEVVRAVFEPEGIMVTSRTMPWKRAEMRVSNQIADAIVGDYYSAELDGETHLYPQWHISVEDPIVVIFKKGRFPQWPTKGVLCFDGQTVGWIRGYGFESQAWWSVNADIHEITTIHAGLGMLLRNRLDALVDYRATIITESKKEGLDITTHEIKTIKPGEKLFLKFSNTDRSRALINIFDRRMEELAASGAIEDIYKKWALPPEKFGRERYAPRANAY